MKDKDFKDLLKSIDQARKIHKGKIVKNKKYKSQCCNAPVKMEGLPDFEGDKYPCTVHYVCTECGRPCDIREEK